MAELTPMVITDPDTDETYTLRFTRNSVKQLETKGFDIGDVEKHPQTRIPELFWGAFLADRPYIKRSVTDDILYNKLGGLTSEEMEKLGKLYAEPFGTLIRAEEEPANPRRVTVQI